MCVKIHDLRLTSAIETGLGDLDMETFSFVFADDGGEEGGGGEGGGGGLFEEVVVDAEVTFADGGGFGFLVLGVQEEGGGEGGGRGEGGRQRGVRAVTGFYERG